MLIVAKSETLAAGVHKPSLLPIAQLNKYASSAPNFLTGPHIMGSIDGLMLAKRGYSLATSVMVSEGEDAGENTVKRAKGIDSSDFISLSDNADVSRGRFHGDKDREINELKTTVAELRDEISRWKTVAQKLKAAAVK